MPLGQALTAFIHHQMAVKKFRRAESKRAVEEELARGGNEQVGAAHHFRDPHGRIVHHHGELVGRHAVAAPHDEVAELLSRDEGLRTEVPVDEGNGFSIGDAEAPGGFRVSGFEFRAPPTGRRIWNSPPARSRINELVIYGVRRGGRALQVSARAGAGIDEAGGAKLFKGGMVEVGALALIVGGEGAAEIRAFVPLEAEPLEIFQERTDELRTRTRGVEILIAKNQHTVLRARALPGGPEGAGVTEVKVPGR